MWNNSALALLFALAAVHKSLSFSLQTTDTKRAQHSEGGRRIANSNNIKSSRINTSLFSTIVERPPAETDEVYGTIVGDTKGAALFLDNVAISRGAEPLLKDINWSVQPNERWGIVGVNGA
jgi:ABC-type multidrug transport system fused ATPase/permease subunit